MSNKSEKTMIESIMAKYPAVNDTYTTEQVLCITNDLEAAISSVEHSGNGEIPEEQILKLADEALTAEKDNPNHITTQLKLDGIRSYNTGYRKGFLTGYRSSLSEIAALQQEKERLKEWKESAMKLTPDYQRLGQLLGIKLGTSIPEQLVSKVEALTSELSSLKEQGDGTWWNRVWDACTSAGMKDYSGSGLETVIAFLEAQKQNTESNASSITTTA